MRTPIRDAPLTAEHAESIARTMHALADRTRVLILGALLHAPGGELHGRDLQEQLGLRQPTASHHLGKLVRAGRSSTDEQRGPYGYYPRPSRVRWRTSAACSAARAPSGYRHA